MTSFMLLVAVMRLEDVVAKNALVGGATSRVTLVRYYVVASFRQAARFGVLAAASAGVIRDDIYRIFMIVISFSSVIRFQKDRI